MLAALTSQAEADPAKIKTMRISVGWNSSPTCSLIYRTCKYVALHSSKDYAIGENFAQWIADELHCSAEPAGKPHQRRARHLRRPLVRPSIWMQHRPPCADRVALRLPSRGGRDLAPEAGGKLRKAIIVAMASEYIMGAVRSMSMSMLFVCNAWIMPMLVALKPGLQAHLLDVSPVVWPVAQVAGGGGGESDERHRRHAHVDGVEARGGGPERDAP